MKELTFKDVWEDFMYWSEETSKADLRKQMTEFPEFAAELWSFWKDWRIDGAEQSHLRNRRSVRE
jgi:hypothetical protein